MDNDRMMELVGPFYLQLMGRNALSASDEFLRDVAGLGRTTTSEEVVWLLRSDWRPRAVGAWFALLHDPPAMSVGVLESLRTSGGSLTAPALAVAATEIAGLDAIDSLVAYCERDRRLGLGSGAVAAAAIQHLGSPSTICESTDEDRADFASLLAVSRRFAAV